MGAAGCTAPDWWSGYPGEAPIGHQQVSNAADFEKIVQSSAAAEAAMNHWGARDVSDWSTVDAAARPAHFFNDFLRKQHGVLPVYEVDYAGASAKQKHTLYWNSAVGKQRWLESIWDPAAKNRAQKIAGTWKANTPTPRMPTLALHLKLQDSVPGDPQKIHVVPEPEFRDHIIEVKKP